MMSRKTLLFTLICIATLVFALTATWATPITVSLDISSLAGADFELEVDVFDFNGTTGDSFVLLDNITVRDGSGTVLSPPGLLDFEGVGLEGFVEFLTVGHVTNVAGAFFGDPGTRQLKVSDDPATVPIIGFRDFFGPESPAAGVELRFDFDFITPAGSGDTAVLSLLDPVFLVPLLPVGVLGPGDAAFLEATSSGNLLAPGTTTSIIPEPSTLVLFALGFCGILGLSYRQRKKTA